ncbi:MAG TPA: type II toxin-antitoxin system RelE/ParE family toxin [Pricia sp.]|nr:type II toxin-antitoxin system RelE/ParE family toxin [Pricia sp.]
MVSSKEVVWSKLAFDQLEMAYRDISQDSPQSAQKVKNDILEKASDIAEAPERYPLDKYRKNNDGSIRAFERLDFIGWEKNNVFRLKTFIKN